MIACNLESLTTSSNQDEETHCPLCDALYDNSSSVWICCDICDLWYNVECTEVLEDSIPDTFFVLGANSEPYILFDVVTVNFCCLIMGSLAHNVCF